MELIFEVLSILIKDLQNNFNKVYLIKVFAKFFNKIGIIKDSLVSYEQNT